MVLGGFRHGIRVIGAYGKAHSGLISFTSLQLFLSRSLRLRVCSAFV